MKSQNPWTTTAKETSTSTKKVLANLSLNVRSDQFNIFNKFLKPNIKSKVLDVGVSEEEILVDTNMFEKLYPWPKKLTAVTIEDASKVEKLYPKLNKVINVKPHKKLPFKNKEFDIVVSWATLEHVGDYKKQEDFLNELMRVGKILFVTTPYRGCFYEPHTGFPFIHWLPLSIFRKVCKLTNKEFWAKEENLNPLWVRDLKRMRLDKKLNVKVYKMFKILPSHLIITNT